MKYFKSMNKMSALALLSVATLAAAAPAANEPSSNELAPLSPWGEIRPDIPDGYMIIEGDIQVPIGFEQHNLPWATNLWSNGIVPYEFDGNVNTTNRAAMIAAMGEWSAVANVTFRARTNETDYVHIQNSQSNDSAVGRQGGQQVINIFNWDYRFIMCHELAHALGFWHEQSRPDRDTYVQINWTHIDPSNQHNFDRVDSAGYYGPYDFDSVMHYGQYDFSSDGERTITVLHPYEDWQNRIGQRDHLSQFDEYIMGFKYPFSNWRFVSWTNFFGQHRGTFEDPYRTFSDGVNNTPNGGTVWVITPGTYLGVGTYNRAMTWQAPEGDVIID